MNGYLHGLRGSRGGLELLQDLNDEDLKRVQECLSCPYFERCDQEVAVPVDGLDESCETKKMFMTKSS